MAYLAKLDDDELILEAENSQDPMVSTPLEVELLARLIKALDMVREFEPLSVVLVDFDIYEPDALRKSLAAGEAFNTLRENFASLNDNL